MFPSGLLMALWRDVKAQAHNYFVCGHMWFKRAFPSAIFNITNMLLLHIDPQISQ